jgi:hypothetical protein
MTSLLQPYRHRPEITRRTSPPDGLLYASRAALAFVILVAALKVALGLMRGLDGDGWVAALVVGGAALSLVRLRGKARSDGS